MELGILGCHSQPGIAAPSLDCGSRREHRGSLQPLCSLLKRRPAAHAQHLPLRKDKLTCA